MLLINILDSWMAPCLVYNTTMYTVYGRCGQYGRCMVHTLAGAAGVAGAASAWFIRTPTNGLREFSDGAHKPSNIALKYDI